jgi:hypothetical protein
MTARYPTLNPLVISDETDFLGPSIKSPLSKLRICPNPVDGNARRVTQLEGDYFDPDLPDRFRGRFWSAPPKCRPRPQCAKDFTGLRHGRLVAVCFYKPSPKGAYWLVRCDCGMYEVRKPKKWEKNPCADINPDRCQFCRHNDAVVTGGNSKARRRDRLMKWVNSMIDLGLTVDEIGEILQASPGEVETRDCTLDQIQNRLRARKIAADSTSLEGVRHG